MFIVRLERVYYSVRLGFCYDVFSGYILVYLTYLLITNSGIDMLKFNHTMATMFPIR